MKRLLQAAMFLWMFIAASTHAMAAENITAVNKGGKYELNVGSGVLFDFGYITAGEKYSTSVSFTNDSGSPITVFLDSVKEESEDTTILDKSVLTISDENGNLYSGVMKNAKFTMAVPKDVVKTLTFTYELPRSDKEDNSVAGKTMNADFSFTAGIDDAGIESYEVTKKNGFNFIFPFLQKNDETAEAEIETVPETANGMTAPSEKAETMAETTETHISGTTENGNLDKDRDRKKNIPEGSPNKAEEKTVTETEKESGCSCGDSACSGACCRCCKDKEGVNEKLDETRSNGSESDTSPMNTVSITFPENRQEIFPWWLFFAGIATGIIISFLFYLIKSFITIKRESR